MYKVGFRGVETMVQLIMDLCPQKIVNVRDHGGLPSQMIDRWRALSCPSHISGSLARYVQTAIGQLGLRFLHFPYIPVGDTWHTIRCWKGYTHDKKIQNF